MKGSEIFETVALQKAAVRRARLRAQYEDANCRADVLKRLPDCDTRCLPKPATQTSISQWPPAGFSHETSPPHIASPPAVEFSVQSCPEMVTRSWAGFIQSGPPSLTQPFTRKEKDTFLGLELFRQNSVYARALNWQYESRGIGAQVDVAIYRNLWPTIIDPLIPGPCELESTPEAFDQYYGRDYALVAIGPTGDNLACLLRFLYMDDFDVCQDIQDIAASGVNVLVGEGGWVWPETQFATPQQRKAQDVIQWVMYVARQTHSIAQGKCNRIKVSDGWNNIWFHIDNGILWVGPTMTPTQFDDAGASAPMGLVQSFVSFAHHASTELREHLYKIFGIADVGTLCPDVNDTVEETETPAPNSIQGEASIVSEVPPARHNTTNPKSLKQPAKTGPTTPPDQIRSPLVSLGDSGPRASRADRNFNGADTGADLVIRKSPRIKTPTRRYQNALADTPVCKTVARAKTGPLAKRNPAPRKRQQAVHKRKRRS